MPISPRVEAAISKMAKLTAQHDLDPVRVLLALQLASQWRTMSPMQRYAALRKLRERR
jgi:hypothetical protein